jgi:hypothetical protein
MLQVLTIVASLFFLVFGTIPYSPCLASNSKNELYNLEPRKKRQKTTPLSPSLSPCLLEFNQFDILAEELIMQIFDHLSFHELRKVKRVCKEWQSVLRQKHNFSSQMQGNLKKAIV